MKYSKLIHQILDESARVKRALGEQCGEAVEKAAVLAARVFREGGRLLICGNGGSAADAQHIAAELVVRLSEQRDRKALPALALTINTSTLTACANDYGFDSVFARQVEAYGSAGDIFIGISTSGNSENVLRALYAARSLSLHTVSFLGGVGGMMKGIADVDIVVPHSDTGRIQEGHLTIGHIMCDIIERELF